MSCFVGTHTVKGFPIWTPMTAFCRAKVEHGLRILHIIYRNYYWWSLSELWLPILTRPRSIIIYIALIGQILSVAFGIRPAAGDIYHLTYQFFPSDIVAAGCVLAVQININNNWLSYIYFFLRHPPYRLHYSYYFFFRFCLSDN